MFLFSLSWKCQLWTKCYANPKFKNTLERPELKALKIPPTSKFNRIYLCPSKRACIMKNACRLLRQRKLGIKKYFVLNETNTKKLLCFIVSKDIVSHLKVMKTRMLRLGDDSPARSVFTELTFFERNFIFKCAAPYGQT